MRIISTLLFCLFVFMLSAQTVTVSEPLSLRNDQGYQIIGKLKDRFLIFRDRAGNDYEVQAFDEKLRASWSKKLAFDRKRSEVIGVVGDRNKFSVFYRFKYKGDHFIKVHKYDAGANLTDSITVHNYGSRYYSPNIQLLYSNDRSKVLLYHTERQSDVEALSFDLENMEVLWKCRFAPDGLNFHNGFREIVLADNGTMFYIMSRKNRRSTKEKHLYEVYVGDQYQGTESVRFFTLPMREQLTYDVAFTYDNLNERLIAAGMYSAKSRGRANGVFYASIPPNDPDNHTLAFIPFDDDVVASYTGKKGRENKGITETKIKEIVARRDGGILMIVERNKLFERQLASTGRGFIGADGRRYTVDYHFEDMIALSIHPNGTLHWNTVMHKRQYSQDDDAAFSSFFLLKTKTSLRLLFNDEIKQENTVSEYVLQGNGSFDRNSVLSTENQKLRLRFRDALQIAANAVVVPSERRNRLQLVLVEY